MSRIIKIGIECESIENDTWGVARLTSKLLEEIAKRPELQKEFEFHLYFKSQIPDYSYLKNPIFKKKIVKPPIIPPSFSFYYYVYLPIFLWFKRVDVMFFPNYMLPLIFFGKSVVMLTDDIYYESRNPKLPFRYRLAYRIFAEWAASHASRIMAISETSKKELVRLFKIKPEHVTVNYLGVDIQKTGNGHKGHCSASHGCWKLETGNYLLYVGQAFPRRHLKETILAFEKISPEFPELKLIALGPDKYETPIIKSLVSRVNGRIGREAVVHKDYVNDDELARLYSGARALVYISDREAFGLPPMEALSFGIPPIIADNELGHELFKDNVFYVESPDPDGIAKVMRNALTQIEKIDRIKNNGPEFVKQYTWVQFTNRWLEIINSFNK